MIKHIVMFRLKNLPDGQKERNIRLLKEKLDALKDSIPEIHLLETGINFSTRPVAFDLVLVSEFRNPEALQIYQDHPEHQKVVGFLNEIREDVAVVDYQF